MKYTFAVVTQVGDYPSNHAILDPDLWIDGHFREDGHSACLTNPEIIEPGLRNLWIALRGPVFRVGEILILGPDGREPGHPGRKPSKWEVACEAFDDLNAAVARAQEVMDADTKDPE